MSIYSIVINTVAAKKDHDAHDAKELKELAELVQLTAPSLTIFGEPITSSFVQNLIFYAPTRALLVYGALK
jgi:hypothetical protein